MKKKVKTFIEFLNEAASDIHMLMGNYYIPVEPQFYSEVFEHTNDDYMYFHTMDVSSINSLKNIQNTNKMVSCFNKWSGLSIFDAPIGDNYIKHPVVAALKGKIAFKAISDVYTKYDKNGMRWIAGDVTTNKHLREVLTEFQKEIYKELDLFIEDNGKFENIEDKYSKVIEISRRLLLKHKNNIINVVDANKTKPKYNEILGYDFEITDIYAVEAVLFYYYKKKNPDYIVNFEDYTKIAKQVANEIGVTKIVDDNRKLSSELKKLT